MEVVSCLINLSFDLEDALSMAMMDVGPRPSSSLAALIDDIPTVVPKEEEACCSICMENFQVGVHGAKQVPCGHVYHRACISSWLSHSNSCPLCRSDISQAPNTLGNCL